MIDPTALWPTRIWRPRRNSAVTRESLIGLLGIDDNLPFSLLGAVLGVEIGAGSTVAPVAAAGLLVGYLAILGAIVRLRVLPRDITRPLAAPATHRPTPGRPAARGLSRRSASGHCGGRQGGLRRATRRRIASSSAPVHKAV